MTRLSLVAALALAGCAATAPPAVPDGHPASPAAPAAPAAPVRVALASAAEPVLPAALRPTRAPGADAMAGMDHASMGHGAAPSAPAITPSAPAGVQTGELATGAMAGMDHSRMTRGGAGAMSTAAAPVPGLAATLDAYLAVHAALAADRLPEATSAAAALGEAFARLTAQPVPGDAHLWHTNADALTAVRTGIAALTATSDIAAARTAFGTFSVPFIRLVQATGVPDGYDLALMRCGMAPGVPDGGVWVQRAGTTANPFFGAAMPRCGSRTGSLAPPATAPSTGR